ncbi:MAG TPA: response regulator [Thermoanaerobaculia bacterium]|jgi:hypothetical protein
MQPRILIVEDESIVAMDLAVTLRRLGYTVVGTESNGAAAMDTAAAAKPDLVLMDIRLKGAIDGIEAGSSIQRDLGIPVVFLTAHGDADTVQRAKAASPYGYLVKPFDERLLYRAVEVALNLADREKNERDRALDALWTSEERFRLLVDAIQDYALFMLDTDGRIQSWNAGAERMTGYSAGEVIGSPLTRLYGGERLNEVRERGTLEWDDVAQRKDGTKYRPHIYCTVANDRAGHFIGFACVTRDETEKRSLEAQLVQAQRLESMGHLAGGIAHDFNNMLMVIFARCELLLRGLDSPKQRQLIHDIQTAAKRNRDLTQQLLAAARQQVLDPEIIDVNDVVRTVVQLLAQTLGENIVIKTELGDDLWSTHADASKLSQVLMNLAINARDAMPSGGTLAIETRNVQIDATYARLHIGVRPGDYLSIVVSDTGTGIPKELQDRIFDPFFTTKEAGRGTGLGLAVVRGIVEQTGGHIWMYSEPALGTTFKIFLPRHAGTASRETVLPEGTAERGSGTILLVEDEPLLATIVRETLEEHGYNVLMAGGPADALAMSAAHPTTIHLLLSDVVMPGMPGDELARRIVEQRPDIRVILMSGYTNHSLINGSPLLEGVRVLEKPVPSSVLLRTVAETLNAPGEPRK